MYPQREPRRGPYRPAFISSRSTPDWARLRNRPPLIGKELLYKLEDDYSDYRSYVESSLGVPDDPAIHAKFKADIQAAREALKNEPTA